MSDREREELILQIVSELPTLADDDLDALRAVIFGDAVICELTFDDDEDEEQPN